MSTRHTSTRYARVSSNAIPLAHGRRRPLRSCNGNAAQTHASSRNVVSLPGLRERTSCAFRLLRLGTPASGNQEHQRKLKHSPITGLVETPAFRVKITLNNTVKLLVASSMPKLPPTSQYSDNAEAFRQHVMRVKLEIKDALRARYRNRVKERLLRYHKHKNQKLRDLGFHRLHRSPSQPPSLSTSYCLVFSTVPLCRHLVRRCMLIW